MGEVETGNVTDTSQKIRGFSLHNKGAFVVRMVILSYVDGQWGAIKVGDEMTVGHTKVIDAGAQPGALVKLQIRIAMGKTKTADEEFIYDPSGEETAQYEITGSLFKSKFRYEGIKTHPSS